MTLPEEQPVSPPDADDPSAPAIDRAFGGGATTDPNAVPNAVPAYQRSGVSRPSRSLLVQALADTFSRTGARIGAAWVLLLVLVAVFAPFIANTRPYLVKWSDGSWSSPLLQGLNWVDLSLIGAFIGGVVMLAQRKRLGFNFGQLLLGFILFLGVVVLTGIALLDPPDIEIYSTWRQAEADGEITRSIDAPIPFSANDALRDVGDARIVPPWWSRAVKNGLSTLTNGAIEPTSEQTIKDLNRLPTSHWLGTTTIGEDMASRMIYATRVALAIGFISTGIATLIGVIYGAIMGYFGGVVDLLLMRVIEIVQAVPRIVLLLIVTVFFGKNIWLMMVTIGLVSWMADARLIRAEFLKLRGQEFVQAARATGLPLHSILFKHMLPNGVAPVLVNASFGVATAILLESILSFLGLGLEATDPSWGQLLNQARSGGTGFNWWIATFPGLAIFLTVFAYILIGESLRDAIDPKLKKTDA